jgi:hypothetical protein
MTERRDLSLDPARVNLWAGLLALGLVALVALPHVALHRENPFGELYRTQGAFRIAIIILVGILVHEILHALGWWAAGRLRWADINFGVIWAQLMPYAHPRRPIPAWSYAAGAAVPGIVLGLVPAAIGLFTGSGTLSSLGAIGLAAAGGDMMVLYTLRGLPAQTLVQDHPTRIGCEALGDTMPTVD